jgi:lysozyme family protein
MTAALSPAPRPEHTDPRFAALLEFVFRWECVFDPHTGLVVAEHHPDDPGGLTKYGIDARSHPGVNIAALTAKGAADIYYQDYYLGSRAAELPDGLADAHFDAAVNVGKSRATKLLQETLGLRVDGLFGPATLAAAAAQTARPEPVCRLLDLRADFYRDLSRRANYRAFLAGWLNRVAALRLFVAKRTGLHLQN